MEHDVPPSDTEVLTELAKTEGGLTPLELMDALVALGYSSENVIKAIQRTFDRGLVMLSAGARLVEAKVEVPVAA